MKIERIELSVFETRANTGRFDLEQIEAAPGYKRWVRRGRPTPPGEIHVLHGWADGVEGMCTVGDARYSTMRSEDLEQLRVLALGESALDRERLFDKMHAATRGMFTLVGWFGAFDNCLWDIAGKAEGKPVCELIGGSRDTCPAYYNFGGSSPEAAADDAVQARERGFGALKDHFQDTGQVNEAWFRAVRDAVGAGPDLLHDAASCTYHFDEALSVGRVLEELDYGWFEEPLADRDQPGLQRLCDALEIPILAPETMMNDVELSQVWLTSGAVDMLRVNARHGMTMTLRLARLAAGSGTTIEANGPGGLFGLVHAHLVCAVENTTYYEYFPGGSRDEVGREIGLLNPPVPVAGAISPPEGPGWGAAWDRAFFERQRVAVR